MITTSLRQVQSREGLCGGSLTAKVRADGQKAHTRPSLVGECAKEHKALWFERYGKCDSCALKVHVLIRGDLLNVRLVNPSSQPLVTTGSAGRAHHPIRANPMTTNSARRGNPVW